VVQVLAIGIATYHIRTFDYWDSNPGLYQFCTYTDMAGGTGVYAGPYSARRVDLWYSNFVNNTCGVVVWSNVGTIFVESCYLKGNSNPAKLFNGWAEGTNSHGAIKVTACSIDCARSALSPNSGFSLTISANTVFDWTGALLTPIGTSRLTLICVLRIEPPLTAVFSASARFAPTSRFTASLGFAPTSRFTASSRFSLSSSFRSSLSFHPSVACILQVLFPLLHLLALLNPFPYLTFSNGVHLLIHH
jgi:hypothetical protein